MTTTFSRLRRADANRVTNALGIRVLVSRAIPRKGNRVSSQWRAALIIISRHLSQDLSRALDERASVDQTDRSPFIRGGDVMMKRNARASLTLVVVAGLCACGSRRSDDDPIAECMDYARAAEPCFGARAAAQMRASFATPPTDEAARAALKARCMEQRTRVERACH